MKSNKNIETVLQKAIEKRSEKERLEKEKLEFENWKKEQIERFFSI